MRNAELKVRIIEALQTAGPRWIVGPTLARLANSQCLTKRIAELRRQGPAGADAKGGAA
jgi:hypothetical protein